MLITRNKLEKLLGEIAKELRQFSDDQIEIRFVGGTAVCLYGGDSSMDIDFDFSSKYPLTVAERLDRFFRERKIPVDFSEDAAKWWMISVGKNRYPQAAYSSIGNVSFAIANPLEILVKKIYRGYDKDEKDAFFLVKHFKITPEQIFEAAGFAVIDSPISEQIFIFKQNVENFLQVNSVKLWGRDPKEVLDRFSREWEKIVSQKQGENQHARKGRIDFGQKRR